MKVKEIRKPWGKEIWWADNKFYLAKILIINAGCHTSFHYHKEKHETMYVYQGQLRVYYGKYSMDRFKDCLQGEQIILPPLTKHRLCALENDCIVLEASTPYPKDVIRLFP